MSKDSQLGKARILGTGIVGILWKLEPDYSIEPEIGFSFLEEEAAPRPNPTVPSSSTGGCELQVRATAKTSQLRGASSASLASWRLWEGRVTLSLIHPWIKTQVQRKPLGRVGYSNGSNTSLPTLHTR